MIIPFYEPLVEPRWFVEIWTPHHHSWYGLSLYWFLGLVEYRYSWIRFMWTFKTFGINFLLFLGSCVIRKLVHSSWWELEKRLCGLEVGWAAVIRVSPNRWPKTESRRLGNQLNEMCWNAFFDAKTMKSISLRRVKLQNEDLRQNALFDAKTLKSMVSSCRSLPTSNYKMKILAKTLYLTLKHWNR